MRRPGEAEVGTCLHVREGGGGVRCYQMFACVEAGR
jgi:hypothetical protein